MPRTHQRAGGRWLCCAIASPSSLGGGIPADIPRLDTTLQVLEIWLSAPTFFFRWARTACGSIHQAAETTPRAGCAGLPCAAHPPPQLDSGRSPADHLLTTCLRFSPPAQAVQKKCECLLLVIAMPRRVQRAGARYSARNPRRSLRRHRRETVQYLHPLAGGTVVTGLWCGVYLYRLCSIDCAADTETAERRSFAM